MNASGGGGPSLDVAAARAAVIGVDVGGTTIKAALVDHAGRLLARESAPTGRSDAAVTAAVTVIETLRHQARTHDLEVEAAGVAVPGLVDRAHGRVAFASNLDWRELELAQQLRDRTGLPVVVDHDVRAAGAAEGLLGAGRGLADFVLLQLGTGIAAAICVGGRIVSGVTHGAGEVGHMPVELHGELCPCGKHGCLEAYASGGSIVRRYLAAGGVPVTGAAEVVARIGTDELAARVWSDAVAALGAGCDVLTNALDPGAIVVGGGLAGAGDTLFEPLRTALARRAVWRAPVEVRPSLLDDTAGVRGAAMAAFELTAFPDAPQRWDGV